MITVLQEGKLKSDVKLDYKTKEIVKISNLTFDCIEVVRFLTLKDCQLNADGYVQNFLRNYENFSIILRIRTLKSTIFALP